ncbi:hypothetical protein WHR41_08317 [Cladosporium halotolerans]|uniref:Rhodopsin domain-containing protein n=1 Tax=Cladosporium halotolerans TaxID=1052096 RepID=A0AB34KCH1_9PEZI
MASPTNTEAIKAALAAQPNDIPPDVTFALLQESRDRPAVIAILFIASFVSVVMALRCYARLSLSGKFGLDDWLAFGAMLPFIAFVVLSIVLIHLGSGRHFAYIQYVMTDPVRSKTEVLDFWAHLIYTTCLLVGRLSGLAFYARIADRHRKLTWAIRITAITMIALYIPQMALIIFHCIPVTAYWPYTFEANYADYTCIQWGLVYVTNSVISLLCDLALFTIPAFIIKKLKVATTDKIKLAGIMMPGLIVIAISSARMYLVIVGQWNADQSWSYNPLLTIEVAEIGSTLVALSVPALKPFFGKVFAFLDSTFVSTSGTRNNNTAGGTGQPKDVRLESLEASEDGKLSSAIRVRHSYNVVRDERAGGRESGDGWLGSRLADDGHDETPRDHSIRSERSEEPIFGRAV